ncbi:hypothetical protein ACNFU2_06435 [Chryseobacterium sp. PTM-20240506]|uniref:hypothetical protein n=1 Tax=Chryseobacterium sp. PTM-20240506 TaxID=3400631 RepID=UPI003AAAFBF7
MEIRGELKAILPDRLTVISNDKDQELDVFFTDSKLDDIKILIVPEKVHLSVRTQSIEIQGMKLGKFWLSFIISPGKPLPEKRGKGQGDYNWAHNQVNQNKK